jgi:hypothetical protein
MGTALAALPQGHQQRKQEQAGIAAPVHAKKVLEKIAGNGVDRKDKAHGDTSALPWFKMDMFLALILFPECP